MWDVAALRRSHNRFITANRAMVNTAMRRAAPEAQKHVRDHAQFTHRSGETIRRTRAKVLRLRGGGKIIITNAARHARWLEYGTKAHWIRARRARYLRFYSAKHNGIIFRKKVWHPGTRPYKFLERAQHYTGDRLRLFMQRNMQRLARRF